MDLGLRGKAAIVGGASEGIGYAIARTLAGEGAAVAMVARRQDKLDEAVARVAKETGSRTLAIPADIRKGPDCERIVDAAVQAFGRLDILVNNDGAPPLGNLLDFDDTAWDKAVQQNLMSVVRLTRRAIPHMRTAGGGRIVNITALSVLQPMPRFGLSVATWAAVIGYGKTLSLEVAADQITVNTICPGRIATGRLAKVFGDAAAEKNLAEMAQEIPVKRIGTPEEVAGLVAFLVSSSGGYVTGATLTVDGGRHAGLR
jgi:3-oxoacyl-[acyl-carrier protein] reductase